VANGLVFLLELLGGEAFVTRWALIPADIMAGHRWITILTAMFLHGSWSHIISSMRPTPRVYVINSYVIRQESQNHR